MVPLLSKKHANMLTHPEQGKVIILLHYFFHGWMEQQKFPTHDQHRLLVLCHTAQSKNQEQFDFFGKNFLEYETFVNQIGSVAVPKKWHLIRQP